MAGWHVLVLPLTSGEDSCPVFYLAVSRKSFFSLWCCRECLRDDIIPYAIKWFTGEAQMEDSDEEDGDEDEDEDEDDEVCFRLADNLRIKNTLATTDHAFQVAVKAWRALCGYHQRSLAILSTFKS